jgi:hypothetical protein
MVSRIALSSFLLLAAAMPACAQERQWMLDASDSDAYLIFGVPDSDDVGVSLWCTVQTDEVNVFVPEATAKINPGADVPFVIQAGDESVQVKGKSEVNMDAGQTSVEAKLPVTSQIFAAMMKSDRFRVVVDGNETVFPLMDADLEGLLALCRKP